MQTNNRVFPVVGGFLDGSFMYGPRPNDQPRIGMHKPESKTVYVYDFDGQRWTHTGTGKADRLTPQPKPVE